MGFDKACETSKERETEVGPPADRENVTAGKIIGPISTLTSRRQTCLIQELKANNLLMTLAVRLISVGMAYWHHSVL